MPFKMKFELFIYYGMIFLIASSFVYNWINYEAADRSFYLLMLILPCFMILSIYHRYYTSENEPGLNLPKHKFSYEVRRRWSWIHAIAGVLYGMLMIALIYFKPAASSVAINSILGGVGLLIVIVSLREVYRLSKEQALE